MSTRGYVVLTGAAIVLAATVWTWIAIRVPFSIRISQAEAQARIDAAMPLGELGHDQIRAASVAFLDDATVAVECDFTLADHGRSASGHMRAKARPAYRGGAFYMEDVKVQSITIANFALKHHDAERVNEFLRDHGIPSAEYSASQIVEKTVATVAPVLLSAVPIYRIDSRSLRHRVLQHTLDRVYVERGALVAELRVVH